MERFKDGRVRIISKRFLTAKPMAEAKKVSCAEDAKIRAKFHAKDLATQKLMTPAGPDFKESQLRCLSKAYPDTVALLSKPGAAKHTLLSRRTNARR